MPPLQLAGRRWRWHSCARDVWPEGRSTNPLGRPALKSGQSKSKWHQCGTGPTLGGFRPARSGTSASCVRRIRQRGGL
eukprot:7167219-Pyramimonas_sp.AAC.1